MSNPNQIYSTVRFKAPRRSLQNLSNIYKSSTDFGKIIPVGLYEIAPGDVMKKNTQVFLRSLALNAPMLHECDIYVHDFFVPWRLVWDDYAKFLIPQDNETAETIPQKPYFRVGQNVIGSGDVPLYDTGSLWDYFGLRPFSARSELAAVASEDTQICSLPMRCYQLIWNEYYRDQNLQDPMTIPKTSGYETGTNQKALLTMRYRAWEKDYFTSALPRPQKGEPMGIDLSGVPGQKLYVQYDADSESSGQKLIGSNGEPLSAVAQLNSRSGYLNVGDSSTNQNVFLDPNGSLYVAPSEASEGYFTIEMLREAMRLQEFMESLMRGGSRYAEVVRNMFGQIPDDLRIGRPAYLGGGKQNLVISEVLQTSQTVADESALGDMAGHALSVGSSNGWRALFKEHGYVISLMSVRPRTGYMQGVNKLWLKSDRYEEMWPLFAHLGEQPVMNGEIFFSYADGHNKDTFGYQPIYTEYRSKPNITTGELRNTLDYWHLDRKFASRPALNADFITCTPSQNSRVFAVTEGSDHFVFEAQNNVKMVRCIPRDGTPTL